MEGKFCVTCLDGRVDAIVVIRLNCVPGVRFVAIPDGPVPASFVASDGDRTAEDRLKCSWEVGTNAGKLGLFTSPVGDSTLTVKGRCAQLRRTAAAGARQLVAPSNLHQAMSMLCDICTQADRSHRLQRRCKRWKGTAATAPRRVGLHRLLRPARRVHVPLHAPRRGRALTFLLPGILLSKEETMHSMVLCTAAAARHVRPRPACLRRYCRTSGTLCLRLFEHRSWAMPPATTTAASAWCRAPPPRPHVRFPRQTPAAVFISKGDSSASADQYLYHGCCDISANQYHGLRASRFSSRGEC